MAKELIVEVQDKVFDGTDWDVNEDEEDKMHEERKDFFLKMRGFKPRTQMNLDLIMAFKGSYIMTIWITGFAMMTILSREYVNSLPGSLSCGKNQTDQLCVKYKETHLPLVHDFVRMIELAIVALTILTPHWIFEEKVMEKVSVITSDVTTITEIDQLDDDVDDLTKQGGSAKAEQRRVSRIADLDKQVYTKFNKLSSEPNSTFSKPMTLKNDKMVFTCGTVLELYFALLMMCRESEIFGSLLSSYLAKLVPDNKRGQNEDELNKRGMALVTNRLSGNDKGKFEPLMRSEVTHDDIQSAATKTQTAFMKFEGAKKYLANAALGKVFDCKTKEHEKWEAELKTEMEAYYYEKYSEMLNSLTEIEKESTLGPDDWKIIKDHELKISSLNVQIKAIDPEEIAAELSKFEAAFQDLDAKKEAEDHYQSSQLLTRENLVGEIDKIEEEDDEPDYDSSEGCKTKETKEDRISGLKTRIAEIDKGKEEYVSWFARWEADKESIRERVAELKAKLDSKPDLENERVKLRDQNGAMIDEAVNRQIASMLHDAHEEMTYAQSMSDMLTDPDYTVAEETYMKEAEGVIYTGSKEVFEKIGEFYRTVLKGHKPAYQLDTLLQAVQELETSGLWSGAPIRTMPAKEETIASMFQKSMYEVGEVAPLQGMLQMTNNMSVFLSGSPDKESDLVCMAAKCSFHHSRGTSRKMFQILQSYLSCHKIKLTLKETVSVNSDINKILYEIAAQEASYPVFTTKGVTQALSLTYYDQEGKIRRSNKDEIESACLNDQIDFTSLNCTVPTLTFVPADAAPPPPPKAPPQAKEPPPQLNQVRARRQWN